MIANSANSNYQPTSWMLWLRRSMASVRRGFRIWERTRNMRWRRRYQVMWRSLADRKWMIRNLRLNIVLCWGYSPNGHSIWKISFITQKNIYSWDYILSKRSTTNCVRSNTSKTKLPLFSGWDTSSSKSSWNLSWSKRRIWSSLLNSWANRLINLHPMSAGMPKLEAYPPKSTLC